MILPTLYTPTSQVLTIGRQPVASGGSGDVYEATFNGLKVCVKRVRVYSEDGPERTIKVPRIRVFLSSVAEGNL